MKNIEQKLKDAKKKKNKYLCITIFVICIVCCFPYIFTQCSGFVDLTKNKNVTFISSSISVMAPFVAIIAAMLSFMAFWIQYEANQVQIAKMEDKEEEDKKVKFENKLYKLIDIHTKNSETICCGKYKGKEAFAELMGELYFYYRIAENCMIRIKLNTSLGDGYEEERQLKNKLKDSDVLRNYQRFLTTISYELLYYGIYQEENKSEEEKELCRYIYNKICQMTYENKEKDKYSFHNLSNIDNANFLFYYANYRLLGGHAELLGHYFRQLFQIIHTIVCNENLNEEEKYEYAKLLRLQMSDSEQLLLYYNSLSSVGEKWNKAIIKDAPLEYGMTPRKEMGLIARFRMIKNIPYKFVIFGLSPETTYAEEIKTWKNSYHKDFFEHQLSYSIDRIKNSDTSNNSFFS